MEGHWVILARVLRVPPPQAVVEEAGDPAQVEQHAAVGEAEGAAQAQPQEGHDAVPAAEEAAAGEDEVAPHVPAVHAGVEALHAVVGPQAEQAALEEPEQAEAAAQGAAVEAGVQAPHAVVGPQAEQAALQEPENVEVAAEGADVHGGLAGLHEEQAVVEEPAEVEVAAQGAAAHEGLEAPHAVVGLQALLEQRITDVDRAAAAGHAAEHVAAEPDFIVTVAPPSRVTSLTAGNTSHPNPAKPDMFPYVVAAGSFCLLVRFSTHPYHGTNFNVRPRESHLVVVRHFRNGANGQIAATAERVPRRARGMPKLNHVEGVGLVCNNNDHTYWIAELRIVNGRHNHSAVVVWFTSGSNGWSKMTLDIPETLRRNGDRAWVPHGTIAVYNTLAWYDLSWGLLAVDGERGNGLLFFGLPPGRTLDRLDSTANIHATRCIGLSGNLMRYVEIDIEPNNPEATTVSMWYFFFVDDKWQWLPNYSVAFRDIWNDASYIGNGLPHNTVPKLMCISPTNPSVVYFSHGQRLFAVDVPNHTVLECENFELVDMPQHPQQASGRFIIPWNLSPGIAEENVGHVPQVPEDVSNDEVVPEQEQEGPSQTTTAWARRGLKSVSVTPMKVRRHSVRAV